MAPNGAPYREGSLAQFIVFRLSGEEFAIPIGEVREIIRSAPLTPVPGAPAAVKGVLNVRGEIAAVVDLRVRFGLPARDGPENKHLVISAVEKGLYALMVDEVAEVLRVAPEEIKPAPEAAARLESGCVRGVVARGGRLIVLLDLAKTLEHETLGPPPAAPGPRRRP